MISKLFKGVWEKYNMENSTSKAIMIGVGIFVTVAITSGILFSINQMKDIYSKVYETDTSMTSRFSEYDAFDNTIVTGVDVINAINKYKLESEGGKVILSGISTEASENFYSSTFKASITGEGDNIKITFSNP